jgi:hypothetical protein
VKGAGAAFFTPEEGVSLDATVGSMGKLIKDEIYGVQISVQNLVLEQS